MARRADERKKLERLCRSVARPPLALNRLSPDGDGLVVHELKRPFRDGTTEFLFEPLDFLARLAALVPRPRSDLIRPSDRSPKADVGRPPWKDGNGSQVAVGRPRMNFIV